MYELNDRYQGLCVVDGVHELGAGVGLQQLGVVEERGREISRHGVNNNNTVVEAQVVKCRPCVSHGNRESSVYGMSHRARREHDRDARRVGVYGVVAKLLSLIHI